ncbi:g3714 [Coccomyxa elongata]
MSHCYKYPRPSVTVDAAIVAQPADGKAAQLLLIQRKNPPCKGQWALPGGFVDENEPLDKAAARELQEETSVNPSDVLLTQVGAFGDPGRDPRGWCVSVAYAALVPSTSMGVKAADDASEAEWFDVRDLPQPLAFDHKLIVRTAFQHLMQQPSVTGKLVEDLKAGAQKLDGPWEPPKE